MRCTTLTSSAPLDSRRGRTVENETLFALIGNINSLSLF